MDEADLLALFVEEAIILRDGTRRQRAAPLGHPLDPPPKLDLLGKQRGSRPTIILLFARPPHRVCLGHFERWLEGLGWGQGGGFLHLPLQRLSIRLCDSGFDADAPMSYKKQPCS